jgi:hypothetical protein
MTPCLFTLAIGTNLSPANPHVMPIGRWTSWPPEVAAAIEQRSASQRNSRLSAIAEHAD